MNNNKTCGVCILLNIMEQALELVETASGVYLEFLLDTIDRCVALQETGIKHSCWKQSQPPYSNTGVTSTPAGIKKQNGALK